MRKTVVGFVIVVLVPVIAMMIIHAQTQEKDPLKAQLVQLEDFIRTELDKKMTSGRFQLQSFSIERTHWHYMLDTATGKLYRMEIGRNPESSKWTLMANGLEVEVQE